MKNTRNLPPRPTLRGLVLALAVIALSSQVARAHPYASGITNVGGTISFILNETADTVGVYFPDNNSTNFLGNDLTAGVHSFSLGAGTNAYVITVHKTGAGGPVQISVDTSNTVLFPAPRGVAVNANPKDRHFGLIYAANSTSGNTRLALKNRGLYVMNADTSDAFGQGTTALAPVFSSASSSSPYRIGIGLDNTVYAGDFSTAAATVWGFNPDLSPTDGLYTNILAIIGETAGIAAGIHGDISGAPCVTGSLTNNNLVLYTADGGLGPQYNGINQYIITNGLIGFAPWSNPPTQLGCIGLCGIAELNTDLAIGKDGKLYGNINRLNYAAPNLTVFATDGLTVLWDSITAAGGALGVGPDLVQDTRTVSVSPDQNYVACMSTANQITIMRLVAGIPDPASLFVITNLPSTGNARAISWDAANNVYAASSGQGLLRIYSLGQTTTAITSNDATTTNGTFQLTTPATQVSVTATTPDASQSGPTPGVFAITRSSVNPADLAQAATVNFTLGGTATNGTYTLSPASTTSITFAPGQTTTNITVTPINDGKPRPTTTVVLSLKGGATYTTLAPTVATILIQNTGPQLVFISSADAPSMYKAFTNDYASFKITRWGDTNAASYSVSTFTYGGTAVLGTEFVGATPITINPGDLVVTNRISPLDPVTTYVGNRTVIVGLTGGTGYSANTSSNATLTIIDNAEPPATVLWSDPLTDSSDAVNWAIKFGNGVGVPGDYDIEFGYNLATDGIGVPPNGSPTALKVTCNKNGTGSGAAVNLYPTSHTFSGNYAVRFNMNLLQGLNAALTTEGALFGINHNGLETNWWSGDATQTAGPWASDGIWYWICSDPGGAGAGDYLEKTGTGLVSTNQGWLQLASDTYPSFVGVFKSPEVYSVYSSGTFTPQNGQPANNLAAATTNWSDVEIKQFNKVVTLSINKSPIFVLTNTTFPGNLFTNGTIMLGYNDPFASVGTGGAVYFSNLRVVSLAGSTVASIKLSGGNVVIQFTSPDGDDTIASFALQSSAAVTGTYADVSPAATFTQLANGTFQVTYPQNGSVQFYRIRPL